jgi:hypothetical protein
MFQQGNTMVRHLLPMILVSLVLQAGLVTAQSADKNLLDGLRKRGLFELARHHCQQQLEDSQDGSRQQVKWTIQLMRTRAAEAQQAGRQHRDELWSQAGEVAAGFIQQHGDHPRRILVQVHAALILLARGELERFEAEVAPDRAEAMQKPQQGLRAAIRQLEQLERELTPLIPQAPRRAEGAVLTAVELVSLQNNVRYQLGRAYRNQALSYPAGGIDRIAALQRATARLEKPLTQLAEDDPLTVDVIRELAACLRLQGKLEPAMQQLARLDKMSLPTPLVLAVRAERVQLALAGGSTEEAIALLQQPRQVGGVISPELDMALLDTFLALLDLAREQMDKERTKQLENQALKLVRSIRQDHGGYWGRRSEIRLVQAVGQQGGLANLGIMQQTADDLYLRGKLVEAIAGYEKAGRLAHEQGADDQAFPLFYKAALVSQQQEDVPAFITRLRTLARLMPEYPQSPLVHLKAIQQAHALAEEDQAWRDTYQQMLSAHLELWPTGGSSNQVRIWLGSGAQDVQDWAAAIGHLQDVSVEDPRFMVVLEVLEDCWLKRLELLDPGQQDPGLQQALAYFQPLYQDAGGQFPARWSPAARQALLIAARLRLRYMAAPYQQVEILVQAGRQGLPEADLRFQNQANAILMVALAGQGKLADADQLLGQIGDQDPQRLFEIMRSLAELAEQSSGGGSRLAALQLKLFQRSSGQRQQLSPPQRVRWDLAHARALAAAGEQPQAAQRLKQLASASPQSASVQKAYAEVLMDGEDAASWHQAQAQWRRILARAKPQGLLWYEAKYAIALGYFKLGKKAEAAARIEYLQATSGLEKTPLRSQFLALLAKCR